VTSPLRDLRPVRKHPLREIGALLRSRQFWAILFVLTGLSQLIAASRLADGLRGAGVDSAILFGEAPATLKDIVVVEIDDETYRTHFSKKVPLDPEKLSALVNSLQNAGAAVIGFDMEPERALSVQGDANVVWAAGLRRDAHNRTSIEEFSGAVFGVPRVLRGRDGIVRRYALNTVVDGRAYLTLTAQIARQACAAPHPKHWEGCGKTFNRGERALLSDETTSLIRFAPDPKAITHVPASLVMDVEASGGWKTSEFFRGKIVLIGGTWMESRDEHITPLGAQYGVYVLAQSVATALAGGGLQEPAGYVLFLVKLLAGIFVGMLAAVLSSRWSVFLHLIIVPVAAVGFAAYAVTANYWVDFVPVLMSGFIHQWFHDVSSHGHETS